MSKKLKKEEADALVRKGRRYITGASDSAIASKEGAANIGKENKVPGTKVVGFRAAMKRIGDVSSADKSASGERNVRKERLEALRSIGEVSDKEYKKRKKGI